MSIKKITVALIAVSVMALAGCTQTERALSGAGIGAAGGAAISGMSGGNVGTGAVVGGAAGAAAGALTH